MPIARCFRLLREPLMPGVRHQTRLVLVVCVLCVLWPLRNQVPAEIVIHQGKPLLDLPDSLDVAPGFNPGQTIKLHFVPGIKLYIKGNYKQARAELLFFLRYPEKTKTHPQHVELHSSANYMLGMIYFYRASGGGRFVRAKQYFEDSIRWNPRNYKSYIELARLLSHADLGNQAAAVLRRLLELQPPAEIERHAREALQQAQSQR